MLSEKLLPTFRTKLAKKAAIGGITTAAFLSSFVPVHAGENERDSSHNIPINSIAVTELEKVEVALQPDAQSEISIQVKKTLDLLELKRKIRDEKIPMMVTEEEMMAYRARQAAPKDRENCEEMRNTEYQSETEREFFLENCVIPESTRLPNRANCTNIRGTDYFSPAERNWYLANCTDANLPKKNSTPSNNTSYSNYSVSMWADVVCTPEFTWTCNWALSTIDCESDGNPNAVNSAGPYNGLFQVHGGSLDPKTNAIQAHIQYVEFVKGIRKISPWPECAPTP